MTEKVSDALAAVLMSARQELNAKFAEAKRVHPGLEGTAFGVFLQSSVDPVVVGVAAIRPERITDTALAAYDIGLQLVGQNLAGPQAREGWVDAAWRRILPAIAGLLAADPYRVAASVTNAAHMLSSTPGARVEQWLSVMEKLAPLAADVQTLLALGQVLAWRCGLAHFRDGALAAAEHLPVPLALVAVGARQSEDWPSLKERLHTDVWFRPGQEIVKGTAAARIGGFRGFGGLFIEPPRVAAHDGQVFVRSKDECWLLTADAFGATFHRTAPEDFARATSEARAPSGLSIPQWLGKVTSTARSRSTLAVTGNCTHAIALFAT